MIYGKNKLPVGNELGPPVQEINGVARIRGTTNADEFLENIYRRYGRVRLDALSDCYHLLKNCQDIEEAQYKLYRYISSFKDDFYEDKDQAMVALCKKRRKENNPLLFA